VQVTGNRGCGIAETRSKASLGAAFAQAGGGVYAMYWATTGIQMWFFGVSPFTLINTFLELIVLSFQRNEIPQDLMSDKPDPTQWSTASAAFSPTNCDPRQYFVPQVMIININICGAWAGNTDVYATTGCTGKCTDNVAKASNYDQAYWEIKYVKTYTAQGNVSTGAGGSGSSTGAGGSQTGVATADIPRATPGAAEKSVSGWWATIMLLVSTVVLGA
jgi:hypothetical protein